MSSEQSIVKKAESALDDIVDLWHRRKLLCVIVVLVVIIPTLVSIFTIPDLRSKLKNAERARDKAELQLAPFLAAANQKFPDKPQDKRLELLLARLDQAIGSVEDAARKISPERTIDMKIKNILTTNLKSVPPLNVELHSVLGDTEGFSLATEIKTIFEQSGWKVNGVSQSVFTTPMKHLILEFGEKPSEELQLALGPLFDALGYRRKAVLNDKLPQDKLKIIVGSK